MNETCAGHVRTHTAVYFTVGSVLFVLTVVTVAATVFHFDVLLALTVGLLIAAVKASLVALFFMHLTNERKLIYGVLILTALFFLTLLLLPIYSHLSSYAAGPLYVP